MSGFVVCAPHTPAPTMTFEDETNFSDKRLICRVFNRVLFVQQKSRAEKEQMMKEAFHRSQQEAALMVGEALKMANQKMAEREQARLEARMTLQEAEEAKARVLGDTGKMVYRMKEEAEGIVRQAVRGEEVGLRGGVERGY